MPQAVGDFLILRAVRESGGFAIAVTDEAIADGVARGRGRGRVALCPETAATYAAYKEALADGRIRADDRAFCSTVRAG